MLQVWFLPTLIVGLAVALSIPLARYLAWIMNGGYRAPASLQWIETRLDTGAQSWKQYALTMLFFNAVAFTVGFLILALQPYLPLNPDGKKMLAPTTIFSTACSFLTNTNLQHYSGEVHLSYFSQLFFVCWKQFVTPAIGLAALVAIVRGLRGDPHMGNFYVDIWRGTIYVLLPLATLLGIVLIASGVPMTLEGMARVTTLEGAQQLIARGPVAAIVAIKQLGSNGGGFFGANSSHPFENPSAWTNVLTSIAILLLPMAQVVMFGHMLRNMSHARIVFGVMLVFLVGLLGWGV